LSSNRIEMDLKSVAAVSWVALALAGCRHPGPGAIEGPPTIKLSVFEVLNVPSGGGNIHVEGAGATPNSEVAMILNYSTASDDMQQLLKTIKSDASGAFTYRGYQNCLFPAKGPRPGRVSLEARDSATGGIAETPNLAPTFLICPK
jgi:hypothetical protein